MNLADFCPEAADVWLIVEAGLRCRRADDADGDGLPDMVESDIPRRPDDRDDRLRLQVIAPGCWPVAFTNPFLIDLDGGRWQAPGLP